MNASRILKKLKTAPIMTEMSPTNTMNRNSFLPSVKVLQKEHLQQVYVIYPAFKTKWAKILNSFQDIFYHATQYNCMIKNVLGFLEWIQRTSQT